MGERKCDEVRLPLFFPWNYHFHSSRQTLRGRRIKGSKKGTHQTELKTVINFCDKNVKELRNWLMELGREWQE